MKDSSQRLINRRLIARAAIVACLFGALAPPSAFARGPKKPNPFRWSRTVESPEITQPTLAAITLDSAIFADTRDDFADLRLRTAGPIIDFELRKTPVTKADKVVKHYPAIERGAKPIEPNGLEISFDPPEKETGPFDTVEIRTPLSDFEQQVRVFASADGQDWHPVSPPTMIFDYSRLVDVRNVEVPIERTGDRHFRLVIDDVTAEQAGQLLEMTRHFRGSDEVDHTDRTTIQRRPFRVDQISLLAHVEVPRQSGVKMIPYPTSDFRASEDAKNKQTIVEFAGGRQPISEIRLLSDETNFSRPVAVQAAAPDARTGEDKWFTVATGTISRLSLGNLQKDGRTIHFAETRAAKYRVLVLNQNSAPVKFTGVEAEGPEYQLLYLADPGESLTLDYQSKVELANPSEYDTAAIRAALAGGIAPEPADLGPPKENAPAPEVVAWTGMVNDPYVIFTVMGFLTVLLGWVLYRASQRIDVPPAT